MSETKEIVCNYCGMPLRYIKSWPQYRAVEYYCDHCRAIKVWEKGKIS